MTLTKDNKETEHSIGHATIHNSGKPLVDKLKFDKIVMTLDITTHEQNDIVSMLETYKITKYARSLKYERGYQHSYRVMVCHDLDKENSLTKGIPADKVAFTVQVNPDLKIKWNPHKIPSAFIQFHLNILLPDGYNRLIAGGKVFALDDAVDIHQAKLEDHLMTYPNFSYSTALKKSGTVITEYLGKTTNDKYFCIYDKTAQIKETNANFFWSPDNAGFEKEPVPKYPIMRIEGRHKFKSLKPSLSDIKTFPDHFKNLKITHHFPGVFSDGKTPKTVEEMVQRLFIQNCKSDGLMQARLNLTPEYRKKMDALIDQHKVGWWCPNIAPQRTKEVDKLITPQILPNKAVTHLELMLGHLYPDSAFGGGNVKAMQG